VVTFYDKFETLHMTCLVDCDVRVQWTSFVMSLGLADC